MHLKTRPVTIALTPNERSRLETFASEIPYPAEGDFDRFVMAAREAAIQSLDIVTLLALDAVKNAASPPAPLVIDNLPFDRGVTRGPVDPTAAKAAKPDAMSEAILVGIAALIGEPYAIRQEGHGLVSNLSPRRADTALTTGLGSRVELGLHIENAAARLLPGDRAPDGLALIGVSPEPGEAPGTIVADGRLALQLAGEGCQRILRDPDARFVVKLPERWRAAGVDGRVQTPILFGEPGAPSFVAAFYGDMIEALDPEAAVALESFRRCLEAVEIDVVVRPGRLVLIDNRFVFHGRRAFEASFDEDGRPFRWLQRVFWTSTLRRFGDWPRHRGRVIEPAL